MAEFVQVAKVSDIPDPGKQVIELDDRLMVLVHMDGEFFCIDDVCTHDGGPLGDGFLNGHYLSCPRHGAKFDVRDGRAVTMPAIEGTACHEVKVEGDEVFVKLREE